MESRQSNVTTVESQSFIADMLANIIRKKKVWGGILHHLETINGKWSKIKQLVMYLILPKSIWELIAWRKDNVQKQELIEATKEKMLWRSIIAIVFIWRGGTFIW